MDPLDIIKNQGKVYKDITEKRMAEYPAVEKALDIVKEFIIKKKLIIYGGLAIDINLKLSGHPGIYQDDAVPDFDCFSSNFYNDSNELANILHEQGFENVSSINAAHFSSRRVRINFIFVFDVSYIPENIYNKLPYLEVNSKNMSKYNKLRILHPEFQRMDMHRAFNIPFSNPPREVILHRLDKDQKRFRLIDERYPMNAKEIKKSSPKTLFLKKEYAKDCVLGGVFGYSLLLKILNDLLRNSIISDIIEKNGFSDYINEKHKNIINIDIKLNEDSFEVVDEYGINKINLISCDFQKLLKKINIKNKVKYYNKFLDNLRPRTILVEDKFIYEIFDTDTELVPCYSLQKILNITRKMNKDGKIDMKNIYLAQPNYILLYFLQKQIEEKNHIYTNLYVSLMNIVEIAEKIALSIKEQNEKLYEEIYRYLPFFLSTETYGERNISMDYLSNIIEKKYLLAGEKRSLRAPFGYYPDKKIDPQPFDPSSSELYQMDGRETRPFEPVSLDID